MNKTYNFFPYWDENGILPPSILGDTSVYCRSPYSIRLCDFIYRYSLTAERKKILISFLQFRKECQAVGLTSGFHWLDGSFMEDIELLEDRPPRDLDIVTFYFLPAGETQEKFMKSNEQLLSRAINKEKRALDTYWCNLNEQPEELVNYAAYWYSIWSRRRDKTWKGFIKIDLALAEEDRLLAELQAYNPNAEAIDA